MRVFSKFPRTFWVANVIELFERWAWYGFFMLFANYLTGSSDMGGLEFSQSEKGTLMGVGTGILYFLPVLTGSIADKYGYKKVLLLAFVIYTSAFILLPMFSTFTGVFLMYLYLALGAALFKPVISATIAKTTNDETSSIGFGIFYMMVNVGAFFGPMVTLLFKDASHLIFYISAGIIALNFILLCFYKEPVHEKVQREKSSFIELIGTLLGSIIIFLSLFAVFLVLWLLEPILYFVRKIDGKKPFCFRWADFVHRLPIGEANRVVFGNTTGIFKDSKFIIFLFIIAGFWTMYNQLFFTLPVFISQWVDTAPLYNFFHTYLPFFSQNYSPSPGVMDSEFITNFDALYIIALQIVVSSIVMRIKPLKSMISGFLVCSMGMALTLFSQNVVFTLVAILVFALGEMAGSPKITEYIGRIAPADKKALYMGYSFIPVFIGNVFAGIISGVVYQNLSDKVGFVREFAQDNGLNIPSGLSSSAYFEQVAQEMNMSGAELTKVLWNTYHPSNIWMVILAIGLVTTFLLFLYDRLTAKSAK